MGFFVSHLCASTVGNAGGMRSDLEPMRDGVHRGIGRIPFEYVPGLSFLSLLSFFCLLSLSPWRVENEFNVSLPRSLPSLVARVNSVGLVLGRGTGDGACMIP